MAPKKKASAKKSPGVKAMIKKKSYTADANNDGCVLLHASEPRTMIFRMSTVTTRTRVLGRMRSDAPIRPHSSLTLTYACVPSCRALRTTTRKEAKAANITISAADTNDDGRTTRAEARAHRAAVRGKLVR